MYNIIYYFYNISAIGGIETFFYQLGKKYHDRDITIIYKNADPKQLERLSEYFNCVKYNGEKIICKQAFFNFNTDIIENVIAEEYILVIHGDYKDMIERKQINSVPQHPKINRYIGVSKLACNSFTELTGIPCELSYNPFTKTTDDKTLMLMSATRLSSEKGFNRMKILAQELDKRNVNYLWFIYTNSPQEYISDNVIYLNPRLDIEKFMNVFDFVIQLSDNEGYCYTVIEALSHKTPVIITPCPVFKELGLNEKNSIYFDFDASNVQRVIDLMILNDFDVKYTAKKDHWNNILLPIKSNYYKNKHSLVKVKATNRYKLDNVKDAELKFIPLEEFEWTTTLYRANHLKNLGYVKIIKGDKDEDNSNNSSI